MIITLTVWRLVHRDVNTAKYGALLRNASVWITPAGKAWTNNITMFGGESGQRHINLGEMLTETVIIFFGI